MSIYRCEICDEFKDDDYEPCIEYPEGSLQLCCEDCVNVEKQWDVENE